MVGVPGRGNSQGKDPEVRMCLEDARNRQEASELRTSEWGNQRGWDLVMQGLSHRTDSGELGAMPGSEPSGAVI